MTISSIASTVNCIHATVIAWMLQIIHLQLYSEPLHFSLRKHACNNVFHAQIQSPLTAGLHFAHYQQTEESIFWPQYHDSVNHPLIRKLIHQF